MRTRYLCPVCGHTVTLFIRATVAPVCAHRDTRHDARRAAAMAPESVAPRRETAAPHDDGGTVKT